MNNREARLGDFGVTVLPGETPSFEDLAKRRWHHGLHGTRSIGR